LVFKGETMTLVCACSFPTLKLRKAII